jgi:peptidoglycan/LPS O-acetylase OafA/YrhL
MTTENRIEHIDVWRFLAIAMVIFAHIIEYSNPWYKEFAPGLMWRARPIGEFGVDLFFCISGFVICRGMRRESLNSGAVNMQAFYIRRFFRILPPLLVYIAVLMVLSFEGLVNVTASQALSAIAFVCNFSGVSCGWFLGHTWSLAFEEQFYLLFPLLFLVCGLAKHRNRLLTIAIAMSLTTLAAQATDHATIGHWVSEFSYMAWGCVFALYWDQLKPLLAKAPLLGWLLVTGILFGSHAVAIPKFITIVIYPALAPLAMCFMILGTPTHHAFVRRIFTNTTCAYLGRISYSIYLWQQLVTTDHGFSSPITTLLLIPCVIAIAHLSFRYFESRMIAIGARLSHPSLKPTRQRFEDPLARPDETSWRH